MSKPIGAAGLALIKRFEGCRLKAYKPVPTEKYWTIGWGHYGPDVREGDRITQAEADAMLAADCQRFADAVDNPAFCPLTSQLNANQRDALISFICWHPMRQSSVSSERMITSAITTQSMLSPWMSST